jgi:hypothetical protein
VVGFTHQTLYSQGKSPWYPLDRRLGGPQSCSGRGGEEKNSQPPPGIENEGKKCRSVANPFSNTNLPVLSMLLCIYH